MAKKISEIDKNFAVPAAPAAEEFTYLDACQAPFSMYGLIMENGVYARMPGAVAQTVSQGTVDLYRNTAGGRIRFSTNSTRIAIRVQQPYAGEFYHMPRLGVSGFDLYRDDVFYRPFGIPVEKDVPYNVALDVSGGEFHNYEINFPLYNNVDKLEIGLVPGSAVRPGKAYESVAPVVFYGSSITQGGCASRPGLAYTHMLSRKLNVDITNLGFSGNAKGEDAMVEYLCGLDMSVFVCDYDHNAPNAAHLAATHEKLVKAVRKAHPGLPIILISRPDFRFWPGDSPARREVIETTYQHALAENDKRIWYINGETLWDGEMWDACSMDGCHPNDLGFYRMAQTVYPVLKEALSCIL